MKSLRAHGALVRSAASLTAIALGLTLPGCGVFAMQRDQEALATKVTTHEEAVSAMRKDLDALRSEVEGAVTRIDQALKANADRGADFMTERARLNELAGRLDEAAHGVDELRKEVEASRAEQNARLDELKRSQEAQPTRPPPVTVPETQPAHYAAIAAAYDKKDFNVLRALGREYVNRYPNDDKADDVLFLMGDAEVKDGHGAAALGEFNRVLKIQPPSNVLGKTLFGMGDAYVQLKDCPNAKLAYQAAASRFAKEPEGQAAKKKLAELDKPAPGTCDAR
jgi:TolA-binding protein